MRCLVVLSDWLSKLISMLDFYLDLTHQCCLAYISREMKPNSCGHTNQLFEMADLNQGRKSVSLMIRNRYGR